MRRVSEPKNFQCARQTHTLLSLCSSNSTFDKHPDIQSGLTENIQKKIKGYNTTPMLYNFEKQQNVRKYISSRKHKQMQNLIFGDALCQHLTTSLSFAICLTRYWFAAQFTASAAVENTAKNSREDMPLLACFPCTIHFAKHSADVFRHIKFKIKNRISTSSHWQA